jgi:hypothetical protein
MAAIFISHSSKDAAFAAEFQQRLQRQGHRSIFLDFDPANGIPAGRDWERELYTQLRACRALVVLCSEHPCSSDSCRRGCSRDEWRRFVGEEPYRPTCAHLP